MKRISIASAVVIVLFILSAVFLMTLAAPGCGCGIFSESEDFEEVTGLTVYKNGNLVSQNVSGEWTNTGDYSFSDTYEFIVRLEGFGSYIDPALCFRSYASSVHVYQDDSLIFQLIAKPEASRPASFDGGRYNVVRLNMPYEESTIRIVYVTSHDSANHVFRPVFIGERVSLITHLVASNLPSLIIGISTLAIALFILIFCIIVKTREALKNLISSAVIVLITGLWVFSQNWSRQLFISNVTQALDISYLMMALLPAAIIFYIKQNYSSQLAPALKFADRFSSFYIAVFILMYAFYLFAHINIDSFLMLMASLLILFFAYLIVQCIRLGIKTGFDGAVSLTAGLVIYLFSIVSEQIILVGGNALEIQLIIYMPYYIVFFIFILRAIGQSIQNSKTARERRRAFALAFTDPLTGLLNRTALINRLDFLENVSTKFHCFFFDLNNLKEVNDTFGHDAGDRLLGNFADCIRKAASDLDYYAFRTGGDEFFLLVKDSPDLDRTALISKIRTLFQDLAGSTAVDFSVGSTEYDPGKKNDLLRSISLADSMMYKDKYQDRSIYDQD